MRLRTTGLLTAALLTAGPLAVTALPASAADACTAPKILATSVSPRTVVVDTASDTGFVVSVKVQTNGCTISGVDGLLTLPSKDRFKGTLTAEAGDATSTTYLAPFPLIAEDLSNADAGTWKFKSTVRWAGAEADESVRSEAKVDVLRASKVTADATSSALTKKNKIRKGKALTIKGALTRADWETGGYTGYAKQRVELQFRTPSGTYKKIKSLKTRSGGAFNESVKVSKDGCYRVVYTGSKTTAADPSPKECIDVV